MIKKIVIAGLIAYGIFIAYQKFIAPSVEPFLQSKGGRVDFMGTNSPHADKR
jgi:hypothetical protein